MPDRLEFYTDEQLGTHQSMTPEGFLLVRDVPIARTGIMKYADGEVPVSAGNDGIIYISRDPDQVFAPEAIASFNGKPVTDEHPPEKVTPENWKRYAIGDVINPRRGDGVQLDNDFLYADLLIKDADAIAAVRAGKREVSAGYDAEYEELAPGQGRQKDIIGNHVALVDKGRCGPRCAIGDSAMPLTSALRNRIIRAITADAGLVEELEKVPDMMGSAGDAASTDQNGHHVTINVHGGKPSTDADEDEGGGNGGSSSEDILARLDALEAAVAALAQGKGNGGGAEDRRTRDRGRGRGKDARARDADRDDDDDDDDDDRRDRSDDRRTRDRRTRDELMGNQSNWPSEGGNVDDIESQSPDRGSMASRPPKESATDRRMRDADEDDKRDDDDDDDDRSRSDDRRTRDRRGTRDRRATRDHMTGDSQSLAEAWRETMALGEILAPGISLPTFDSKQPPRFTMDALCAFRRKALAQGYRDGNTRQVINDMLGPNGRADFNNMTCDAIAPLFAGAAQIMRRHNAMVSGQSSRTARVAAPYQPPSPADINARNRQRYGYA